uniref:Uncharacterized protein n=1 Tax=Peronospora matthiolae TaxID=2874970 RepID=A0AAV1THS9_9STRA
MVLDRRTSESDDNETEVAVAEQKERTCYQRLLSQSTILTSCLKASMKRPRQLSTAKIS